MKQQHNGGGRLVRSLAVQMAPVASDVALEQVAERFLDPAYRDVLSLPVVDEGRPVGVISRYRFMDVYLKPYGRELYGKQPVESIMGKKPLVVAHDQTVAEAALHVTQNMRFPLTEDFIITENGRYIGIGFVLDLLKAMEGEVRAHADELDEAYSRLKSSQLALVQSEKMASLGQMVAGIAHEINTPLGYVRNNVAMGQELFAQVQEMNRAYSNLLDCLLDEQADEARLSGLLQQASAFREAADMAGMLEAMNGLMDDSLYGIGQISELVLNLKDFSRMDAATEEPVNLNRCIESALRIGNNVLKNGIRTVTEFGELPDVMCAPSQLNQVFLNLITNAAQAMEEGGELHIRSWSEAGQVRVSVRDTGRGIPEEIMARIFDPFFTTKPVGQGTGLGLAITHQIIQRHGGDISVESQVGEGTCFHVRLPAGEAGAAGKDAAQHIVHALLQAA